MNELMKLFFSKRFILAGTIILGPALIIWFAVVYYGTIFLSEQWFPFEKQTIINGMTTEQKLIYVKNIVWWFFGFTGITISSLRIIFTWVAKFDGLILSQVAPAYIESIKEYERLSDKQNKEQGPAKIRRARRRLERWQSNPDRFNRFYRFSIWRLMGKSKDWIFNHYTKAIKEWERDNK